MTTVHYSTMDSPCGELLLVSDGQALVAVWFPPHPQLPSGAVRADELPLLVEARHQFAAYFTGELHDFDLPLAPAGTPFQQEVWAALRAIPYAETTSYGALARSVGRPLAARAVGAANGRNPLAIVVPCHRVIGGDGTLTGYAGGHARKRLLLDLEAGVLALQG